jgi:site-specific DNA recombinase
LRSRLKKCWITKSTIQQLLKNPFYYGYMFIKGEIHKHRYEQLIDFSMFQACQNVTTGRNKKPFKYAGLTFLFRGLVRCAKCGTAYSSEIKKGKYVYLRPKPLNGCDCKPVKEEIVLNDISDTLKVFSKIPAPLMEEVHKRLKASSDATEKHQNTIIEPLQKEAEQISAKSDRLLDLRIDGSITQDQYDKKAYDLSQRKRDISLQLERLTKSDQIFSETLSSLLNVASHASEIFEGSETEQKRKIINFVFPNLEIMDKKVEKSIRKPLDKMMNLATCQEWLRTRYWSWKPYVFGINYPACKALSSRPSKPGN